jgi:hypothetical protein
MPAEGAYVSPASSWRLRPLLLLELIITLLISNLLSVLPRLVVRFTHCCDRYGVDMDFMGCTVADADGYEHWVNVKSRPSHLLPFRTLHSNTTHPFVITVCCLAVVCAMGSTYTKY